MLYLKYSPSIDEMTKEANEALDSVSQKLAKLLKRDLNSSGLPSNKGTYSIVENLNGLDKVIMAEESREALLKLFYSSDRKSESLILTEEK